MIRFLRENAELITTICVVLSLLLGGTLLYLKHRSDTEAAAIAESVATTTAPVTAPAPDTSKTPSKPAVAPAK